MVTASTTIDWSVAGASDANIDQAWISRGYATMRLIQSGCSCFRNFGTAALM